MATELRCDLEGWGAVADPRDDHDGDVQLDMDECNHFIVDDDLADALVAAYDQINYADPAGADGGGDDESETDSTDEQSASDETPDSDGDDLADLSYRELQDRASEFDDVSGNQSADDLRSALREKQEG